MNIIYWVKLKKKRKSNMNESLVSKVWSFCNVLKDDSVGYNDYLEQFTYLLL